MKIGKKKNSALPHWLDAGNRIRLCILFGLTVVLTAILYPNLVIPDYTLELGDVAQRDIKAPRDFFIEDEAATETRRRAGIEEVRTVYDHDDTLLPELSRQVKESFAHLRAAFSARVETRPGGEKASGETPASAARSPEEFIHDRVWELKPAFEEKIGLPVNEEAYKALEKDRFSENTQNLIIRIMGEILKNGVAPNKEILLKESEKGIVLRDVGTKKEKIVNALKHFYGHDQAQTMVRVIGQPLLKNSNHALTDLVVDFVQRLIHPNITPNRSATEERRKEAAAAVKPVLNKIKAGEMIIREGERVTSLQVIKLKFLQEQARSERKLASVLGAGMVIFALLLTPYVLFSNQRLGRGFSKNRNLLLMASVLIVICVLAKISGALSDSIIPDTTVFIPASAKAFGIPLASGAMIICLFLGLPTAIPFAVVAAACTAIIFQNKFDIFLYFMINGVMAAYWIQHCNNRNVFIKAGLKLGALNILLATALGAYLSNISGYKLVWDWTFAFLGGVVTGVVTAGLAPLIELAFGYTTDIKLLELANLDQPLLRRQMIEAPGTYHHSVVVGALVEAAASEIGANPLLAKV
ncbi:MAG: HD family phosphohydrolase, partial [Desulfobacterales bacterium]|nr:HD family phosphohydrolase [Desulfobacterales bacterium]